MRRIFIVLFAFGATPALADECYDVGRGQPATLTGLLDYVIYPGPPNYRDVQRGDTPEPNYVLRLAQPICLTGDPDFANPARKFSAVQVVGTKETTPLLRANLRRRVVLSLTNPMAAETGHHHEPLVAWVTAVRPVAAKPIDFLDEYGTPATTIRAFYDALHDGQGPIASMLVVPEKRKLPAFSAVGLSHFYGSLAEPIRLIEMKQGGQGTYEVRYRYSTKSRRCNGRAIVMMATRGGKAYIGSVRPLDGC